MTMVPRILVIFYYHCGVNMKGPRISKFTGINASFFKKPILWKYESMADQNVRFKYGQSF
jgi:hypothetical protein